MQPTENVNPIRGQGWNPTSPTSTGPLSERTQQIDAQLDSLVMRLVQTQTPRTTSEDAKLSDDYLLIMQAVKSLSKEERAPLLDKVIKISVMIANL